MMKKCPICQKDLMEDLVGNSSVVKDSICQQEDHFFGERIDDKNDTIMVKIILKDPNEKLFLSIDYKKNYSRIWTKANDPKPIKMPGIIISDFSDRDKLKRKIKTCLLFS